MSKLLSIEALAELAGVSTKTIVDLEHGRTVPKLRTISRLSKALEVEPTEIEEFSAAIVAGSEPSKIAA